MYVIAFVAAVAATAIPVCLIGKVITDKTRIILIADKVTAILIIIATSSSLYIIANTVVRSLSEELAGQDPRPATFTEAQAASGFQSGYEYPLALGDRGYVSYSSEKVTHDLFYFNMTSQTISSSSILVGYQHADGIREIVEIPISTINFRITADSSDASLSVDLGAIDAPADGYAVGQHSGCPPKVIWGWWVADCSAVPTTMTTPGDEGVAGLLQRAFAANSSKIVTMTVTEKQYSKILGAPESS